MTPPRGSSGPNGVGERQSYFSSFLHPTTELEGHTIIVAFNPAARDGKIAAEYQELERILRGHGARVVGIETVADLAARRSKIFTQIQEVLQANPQPMGPFRGVHHQLPRVLVLPYGGDGTIWETVGETVQAAGISLEPTQNPEGVSEHLRSQVAFLLAKKGTASDNAVQVGAPKRARSIPRFVSRAVELPFRYTIIETPGESGPIYEVAGHSYSLGVGGYLFDRREQNRAEKPNSFWNQGLRSYFRLIPHALFNRYGLLGMEVGIRHFDAEGNVKQSSSLLGSEVIVTPNRIIAGAGGVPGAWGETKMVILPPDGRGLLSIGEYIFRGLMTKMGWNLVGPKHRLRTLSSDRQILVRPGERVEVETRVPNTLSWDFLRFGHEKVGASGRPQLGRFYRWLGFGQPGPPIPPAGEPLVVPAQRNGDVVPPSSRFTVYSPDYAITMLAHSNSLAVRLARSSALMEGINPLISDQNLVAHTIPHDEPKILERSGHTFRVRTPFISQPRLLELMSRSQYRTPLESLPDLLTAARLVQGPDQLGQLAHEDLNLEKIHEFLETNRGDAWMASQRGALRGLGQRSLQGGVPFGVGIGALFAADALSDHLELDPIGDRELRFAMMMYLGHAANTNVAPLWEVASNRLLGRPYDYVRTRNVRVAGETLTQWTYARHSNLGRAMGGSWRTGALALDTGVRQTWLGRVGRFSLIPLRGAWNMGHGLMFSRLTESLVQDLPSDSRLRNYGPTLAFFAPDLGRILAPKATFSLLNPRPMGFAGRVFAAGFIGDMAFTGLQHLSLGSTASRERQVNFRAAQLRRQRGDISTLSWRNLVRFLAPTIGDHVDTHDYLFGGENSFRRDILQQDQELVRQMHSSLREDIPLLLRELGGEESTILGESVQLNQLEQDIQDHLIHAQLGADLPGNASLDQTAQWIQGEFSGHNLEISQVRRSLARIHLAHIQENLSFLSRSEVPQARAFSRFFDSRGRLLPGTERQLEDWLHPDPNPTARVIFESLSPPRPS